MEHLEGILKLIDKEFGMIESNGEFRGRDEIESVYKLMDIAKDVHEIWKCEDEEEEYSNAMMRDGYAYRGGSYNDGMMYSRRGARASRDNMGRYSSRNVYRQNGYSRADRNDYMNELRMMMNDAPDEQTRESMRRMIDQMGNQ